MNDHNDLKTELRFRGEGPLSAPTLTTDVCSPFHYLKDGIGPDVAVYSISGWYDGGGYANGAITRYLTLKGPNDRLLLGPWDHGARTHVSPWRDGSQPQFPMMDEVLRFFDEHLMGVSTGLRDEAPVHYFSIHEEAWKHAAHWPPTKHSQVLHLAADGLLTDEAPAISGAAHYKVKHRNETGRGTRWARLGGQNVDAYYEDWGCRPEQMLNFQSGPFQAPLAITGHIVADLWLSSSQPDVGLFVYASEVSADGSVRYITEGLLRGLHRKVSVPPEHYVTSWPYRTYARDDAQLMPVGEMCNLIVPLLPISWTSAAGSRLMISISGADSANFPQVCHGQPPSLQVGCGGVHGSTVRLPVEGHETPRT